MSDLDELRLPATIAQLARRADSLPSRDRMADLNTAQLAIWLRVREQGLVDSRCLIPAVCSQGAARDALADLTEMGYIRRYQPGPNAYIVYWDPDETEPPERLTMTVNYAKGEPITDGGRPSDDARMSDADPLQTAPATCPCCGHTAPIGCFMDRDPRGCPHCDADLDELRERSREVLAS